MKVNRREDIGDVGRCHVELGEELDLSTRNLWVNAELSGYRYKILLENLNRNYSGARLAISGYEINCYIPLGGCRFVVRIDEDICVKESARGHESRRS